MLRVLTLAAFVFVFFGATIAAGLVVLFRMTPRADETPTLSVEVTVSGLDASAVEDSIAAPIEQQVNGVERMRQLYSRSGRDGSYTLMASFDDGIDLNLAQILVQNRVALAVPILPTEVQSSGVTIRKQSPDPLLLLAVFSPDGSRDATYLTLFAAIQLRNELARLPGIARVSPVGGADLAARITLDPARLVAHNLTVGDVVRALKTLKAEAVAGAPNAGRENSPILLEGASLGRPKHLDDFVIKTGADSREIRLLDVASSAEIGPGTKGISSLQGKAAAVLAVHPLSGGNRQEASEIVRQKLSELSARFPKGVDVSTRFDFSEATKSARAGFVVFDVDLPEDASAAAIAKVMSECDQLLRRITGVADVLTLSERPFDFDSERPCLVASLEPNKGNAVDTEQFIGEIRREMHRKFVASGQVASIRVRAVPGAVRSQRLGYPIAFAISGPERPRIQELVGQLVARMAAAPGLTDVHANLRTVASLTPEVDRAKASVLGLGTEEISASVQAVLSFAPAGNVVLLEQSWPVRVRVDAGTGNGVGRWNDLKLRTRTNELVPLAAVATVHQELRPSHLERIDMFPAVSITAAPVGGLSPAGAQSLCGRLAAEIFSKQNSNEYRLVWLGQPTR